jgi:Mn2+/Fe2+ NRAMP family transporter
MNVETNDENATRVNFANGWINIFWAVVTWLLIVILNVAAIVLLGLGQGDDD